MPKLFHDGSPYHIGTSPLICIANQWTGFYIIGNCHERINVGRIEHKLLTYGKYTFNMTIFRDLSIFSERYILRKNLLISFYWLQNKLLACALKFFMWDMVTSFLEVTYYIAALTLTGLHQGRFSGNNSKIEPTSCSQNFVLRTRREPFSPFSSKIKPQQRKNLQIISLSSFVLHIIFPWL